MLCDEIEKIVSEGNLNRERLELLHKLTDTLKNLYKIEMYGQAERGYSGDGMPRDRRYSNDGMSHGGSYDDEYSNRMHHVRGHYSHEDGKSHMIAKLEDIMHDAPTERDREAIRKCINQMHDM